MAATVSKDFPTNDYFIRVSKPDIESIILIIFTHQTSIAKRCILQLYN